MINLVLRMRSAHRLLLLPAFVSALHMLAQPVPRFVENRGQWPSQVLFRADAPDAVVWCERGSILIDRFDASAVEKLHAGRGLGYDPNASRIIRHHAIRLRFAGSTGLGRCEGIGVQAGTYNYFLGNDSSQWASNAHGFAAVVQHHLYPGVDLRLRAGGEVLKYDLVVAPGADPEKISFTYEGTTRMAITDGKLHIATSLGDVIEDIPLAYQIRDGILHKVECRYSLKGGRVSFKIGPYDQGTELVIDPTLSFSSYSGSTTDRKSVV